MLDARNDDSFLKSVEKRELQAVGGLAYLLRLKYFTHAKVDFAEGVDVDFFLDFSYRIGIAVDLLRRGFLLDGRLVKLRDRDGDLFPCR